MTIDTNTMVSITEANQNFSKVACKSNYLVKSVAFGLCTEPESTRLFEFSR